MFVRTKQTPNSPRKSIQIVESIRIGHEVKQKIVRYVGVALNEREEEKLIQLANEFMVQMEQDKLAGQQSLLETSLQNIVSKRGRLPQKALEDILPTNQVLLEDIKEEARIIEGIHEIGGLVYDQLGYNTLLKSKKSQTLLRDLVLARIVCPESKLGLQKKLDSNFDKEYDLDAIYRLMDHLHEQIPTIKALTFKKTASLFPGKTNVLLFDVTTLYFESTDTDELREFGFSKDHRFNTTQVVLALATNEDGLPIGYELFKGNKAEVQTLCEALKSWEKSFDIGSVCFVGDRAMFSEKNLTLLEQNGYYYVVAAKLRKLPGKLQDELLEEKNYKMAVLKNELAWIGEFTHNERRLIVSYKQKRAINDARQRETLIKKIETKLGASHSPKQLLNNHGVKKYTSISNGSTAILDKAKIQADALWDGLHGVITNITDEDAGQIIGRYARLWIIEDSFRINKHNLKIRPIYHWKPNRIEAHIALCYMSFSVLRHLQYQVNLTQKLSVNEILDELLSVQASIHIHKRTHDRYRVPGALSHKASKIYKAFNLMRSQDAEIYLK